MAAQLLAQFNPSGEFTPSFLHHFTPSPPPWQPTSNLILSHLNSLQSHSYNILPPLAALLPHFSLLNKLPPHSYKILSPLAAQLLNHFTPSEEFTPSLLHYFTPPLGSALTSFYPL